MKYLHAHIQDLVNESDVYLTDAELVDSVDLYLGFLEELLALIDVRIFEFQGFEGETRMLKFKMESSDLSVFVKGNTDIIDYAPIIKAINKTLKDLGKSGKYYSFWSGDFGQEIGFFYLENNEVIVKLHQLISKNSDIGIIDNVEIESNAQTSRISEGSSERNSNLTAEHPILDSLSIEEGYSKQDYIMFLIAFILIMFGTFFELLFPSIKLNVYTGMLSGGIIGFGIYQINKRI